MSAGAVVIDLGEVVRGPAAEEPYAGPVLLPSHRRLFGVLLALVLVVAAAVVPTPTPLIAAVIPTADRDILLYGRDRYYVFGLGDGPQNRTLTAYRMPDARRLWHVRLPPGRIGWLTVPDPGVAELITEEWPAADGTGQALVRDPAAVIAGAGRVLYRAGSQLLGLYPGGGVLLWTSRGGEFAVEADGRRLVSRSPESGVAAVRWSYDSPPGSWLAWDPAEGGLGAVAVMLPSGRLELRDLERGTLIAAADVSVPRRPAEPPAGLQLTGDLVLVEQWRDGRVLVSAYGRQRLDRRWTIPMDLAVEYVTRCGRQLCAGGLNGGIRVLDADTGATRWSSPRWSFVAQVGDALLAGPAGARPNGTRPRSGGLALLDPATGAVRADLGGWAPVWPLPVGHQTGDPRAQAIAVRHDLRTHRAWFARIVPESASGSGSRAVGGRGGLYVVGAVTGVTDDCRAGDDWVACRRPDGRTGVWRLPRA